MNVMLGEFYDEYMGRVLKLYHSFVSSGIGIGLSVKSQC